MLTTSCVLTELQRMAPHSICRVSAFLIRRSTRYGLLTSTAFMVTLFAIIIFEEVTSPVSCLPSRNNICDNDRPGQDNSMLLVIMQQLLLGEKRKLHKGLNNNSKEIHNNNK